MDAHDVGAIVGRFVKMTEAGEFDAELFAPDVFCDLNVPEWRYQIQGSMPLSFALFEAYDGGCTVRSHRWSPTATGFVLEWEVDYAEGGRSQYTRQVFFGDVGEDGRIRELRLWCTGVWDAATVERQRREAPMLRTDGV